MTLKKKENLLYLSIWGLLYITPIWMVLSRHTSPNVQQWHEVLITWKIFSGFLIAFLIHNSLILPQLIYHSKRLIYLGSVMVLLTGFALFHYVIRPKRPAHERIKIEHLDRSRMVPEDGDARHVVNFPHPPTVLGHVDIMGMLIVILMLGFNAGVKYFFYQEEKQKRYDELQRKSLQQQLEYLKYQINPHFFMNTLNNIHALIDINPAQAQSTLLQLSKLMRFVLYEGNKPLVSLKGDFQFIGQYIDLMRIRYSTNVTIKTDLPTLEHDALLPPLLLITFIENAFKHGVSYNQESYITIKAEVKPGELHFECMNSVPQRKQDAATTSQKPDGGIGLSNVKKRLSLIYNDRYTLETHETETAYHVWLTIPLNQCLTPQS